MGVKIFEGREMALVATLDIYSGRPNPKWMLSERDSQAFTRRSGQMKQAVRKNNQLGYRGVTVYRLPISPKEYRPETFKELIHGNDVDIFSIYGDADLESWILETAQGVAPNALDYVKKAVADAGKEVGTELEELRSCLPCLAPNAPTYDPSGWQTGLSNCYNYANDRRGDDFAQPGTGGGFDFIEIDCQNIATAAEADGLQRAENFSNALASGWYVSLAIWPGIDFHWYRQDIHGCWSHKIGAREPTDLDQLNRTIQDPRLCDRGPYTEFCSYMITDRHTAIRG